MNNKEALKALQFLQMTFTNCDFNGTNSTELWNYMEDAINRKRSFWKLVFGKKRIGEQ